MPEIKYGTTRTVLLVGGLAIKIPSMVEWRLFLYGLLGNMQEARWWREMPDSRAMMCPVLFAVPGGFLTVKRRATPVTDEEWFYQSADGRDWYEEAHALCIPVENKVDSWGRIDGRIVAVDYGSNYRSGYDSDSEQIERLQAEGHSAHCAQRQVWGDGECECKQYQEGYDPYAWARQQPRPAPAPRTFEVKFHPRTWELAYRHGTPGMFPAHLRIGCFTISYFKRKR